MQERSFPETLPQKFILQSHSSLPCPSCFRVAGFHRASRHLSARPARRSADCPCHRLRHLLLLLFDSVFFILIDLRHDPVFERVRVFVFSGSCTRRFLFYLKQVKYQ